MNPFFLEAPQPVLLRARAIVPVSRPDLADGAVALSGGSVRAVGRWADLAPHWTGPVRDLGEVVLLPGLLNAHCHLDYTDMAGQIAPCASFTDWIKSITALKGSWNTADFAQSWQRGARMLLETGTTTVADIELLPTLIPNAWDQTPLRVFSFLEMTGVKSRRQPELILAEAVAKIASLPVGRSQAGLSPHAPYSTLPALLAATAQTARERRWRVTTHVAESAEEYEMFESARGPLYEWLARNERDMADCGGISPVQSLERSGLLSDNLIVAHANYLDADDAGLLARRQVSVVHCPRSHAYFGHRPFPFHSLQAAGVNICLGTDSLATVRREPVLRLDLLAEMRAFVGAYPAVGPRLALEMTTVHAARALGLAGQRGELASGTLADLVAIPFSGDLAHVAEAIVAHQGNMAASMIGGLWAISPDN